MSEGPGDRPSPSPALKSDEILGAVPHACGCHGNYAEREGANCKYQLLSRVDRCMEADLQNAVNTVDANKLKFLADRIVELGTPSAFREWLTTAAQIGTLSSDQRRSSDSPRPTAASGSSPPLAQPARDGGGGWRVGRLPFGSVVEQARPPSWFSMDEAMYDASLQVSSLLMGRKEQQHVEEPYLMPRRLARRVVPVLYAWITDWDFMCRNPKRWCAVASCFTTVCVMRPCHSSERPGFTLPWKPLLELVLGLTVGLRSPKTGCDLTSITNVIGGELMGVCQEASCYFGDGALEGLWGVLAPHFTQRTEEAPLYLCLLTNLLPTFCLEDKDTGAPLPLAQYIVDFLFTDAYCWPQDRALWMVFALKLLARMHVTNVGLLDMDRHAEAYFTAVLQMLRLPIGDATKAPKVRSRFGSPYSAFSIFSLSSNEAIMAQSCVTHMLPANTQSPLWNQLRRCLHATGVFLRPGTRSMEDAKSVFTLYGGMVSNAHLRVGRQRRYERWRDRQQSKQADGTGASTDTGSHTSHVRDETGDDDLEDRQHRRAVPAIHLWTQETVDTFVTLMAPAVLPSLHFGWSDASRVVGLLADLSPEVMLPHVLRFSEVWLHSSTQAVDQMLYTVRVLVKCTYTFLTSDGTCEAFTAHLREVVPLFVTWMSASTATLSQNITHFLFAVSSVIPLTKLLGAELELEVASTFARRVVELCDHLDSRSTTGGFHPSMYYLLQHGFSDAAFQHIADTVLREAEQQGCSQELILLVTYIGSRAPQRVMQLAKRVSVPVLMSITSNDAATGRAARLLSACIAGAGRGAFDDAPVVAKCICALSSHITNAVRRADAALIYTNLCSALRDWRCTGVRKRSPVAEREAANDGGESPEGVMSSMESPDEAATAYAAQENRVGGGLLASTKALQCRRAVMGFCDGADVELTWDKPSEKHMTFLLDLYDECMEDVEYLVQHIESVRPMCGTAGIRGLVVLPGAEVKPGQEEAKEVDSGIWSTEPFTPRNVLNGAVRWLQSIVSINYFCYAGPDAVQDRAHAPLQGEEVVVDGEALQLTCFPEWWDRKLRCQVPSPLPLGRAPRYTCEGIIDFVVSQLLRCTVGTGSEAVEAAFGPEVAEVVDLPVLHDASRGATPLDPACASLGDCRVLEVLLTLLMELVSGASQETLCPFFTVKGRTNIFEALYSVPRNRVDSFPMHYWAYRAECLQDQHAVQRQHTNSRQRCETIMNIAHVLTLSTHARTARAAFALLFFLTMLLHPVLRRLQIATHTRMLVHFATSWLKRNPTAASTAETFCRLLDGEGAATADAAATGILAGGVEEEITATAVAGVSEEGVEEEEEEEEVEVGDSGDGDAVSAPGVTEKVGQAGSKKPEDILSTALLFAVFLASGSQVQHDAGTLLRLVRLLLYFPDPLVSRRAKASVRSVHKKLTHFTATGLSTTEALWVSEELVLTALHLRGSSPLRATLCMKMAASLYRLPCDQLPSTRALYALARLAVHPFTRLHQLAVAMLHTSLARVADMADDARDGTGTFETDVLLTETSAGSVDLFDARGRAERIDFFRRRYAKVKARFPHAHLSRTCQVFLARSMVVRGRFAVSGDSGDDDRNGNLMSEGEDSAFLDGAPVQPPREHRIVRHRYCAHVFESLPADRETSVDPASTVAALSMFSAQLRQLTFSSPGSGTVTGVESYSVMSPEEVRRTWAWRVLERRQELFHGAGLSNALSEGWWDDFGRSVGREVAVPLYISLIRAQLAELRELKKRLDSEARESPHATFVTMLELCVALVSITTATTAVSATPELRVAALECCFSTILFTCRREVPHEVSRSVVVVCSALAYHVTAQEAWQLYQMLFNALLASEGDSTSSQEQTRILAMLLQLLYVFSFEVNGELLPRLVAEIMRNQRVFFTSETTQSRRFAGSVVRQLLRMCQTNSDIIEACEANAEVTSAFALEILSYVHFEPLRNPAIPSRPSGSSSSDEDDVSPSTNATVGAAASTAGATASVTTAGAILAEPAHLYSPWSQTPALGTAPLPTPHYVLEAANDVLQPTPMTMQPQLPVGMALPPPLAMGGKDVAAAALRGAEQPLQRGGAAVDGSWPPPGALLSAPPALPPSVVTTTTSSGSLTQGELNTIKTVALCWYDPPAMLLARHGVGVVCFLANALDVMLPEMDDLYDTVAGTLHSFAFKRVPKVVAHELLECICNILLNRTSYGTSRKAKTALTKALRLLLFSNLHRIGKYAMITMVAEAALTSLEHGDGRLRAEGKLLFSVLAKVASVEQTHALVQQYERELRGIADTVATGALTSAVPSLVTAEASVRRRRFTALVLGLCSIVLADPGQLPPYTPRLMERLVSYSHGGISEASHAIKRTFEEWWRSHRDGWESEYKRHFTVAQIEAMMSLLTAPSYYA